MDRASDHPIVRDFIDMVAVGRFVQKLCYGTGVFPCSSASGSSASHGPSTNARCHARGCGNVRSGSSLSCPSKSMMSKSSVRDVQWSVRTRPC